MNIWCSRKWDVLETSFKMISRKHNVKYNFVTISIFSKNETENRIYKRQSSFFFKTETVNRLLSDKFKEKREVMPKAPRSSFYFSCVFFFIQ